MSAEVKSEVLVTENNLDSIDKSNKQKTIDDIMKNIEINNQKDFRDFYNFLKNLDWERLNILLKNIKIIKEEKVIFEEYYMYKLILKKTAEIWLELNEKHIKILNNNPDFYRRFIIWRKTNWWEKPLDINDILKMVDLFNSYKIKIPRNLLEEKLVVNLDWKKIEEKLKIIKKFNIKKIESFFIDTLNVDIKFSDNFFSNFDKLTKKEKFDYFLKNNYLVLNDANYTPLKLEKENLKNLELKTELWNFFGDNFSWDYYEILNKKNDWRLAFSVYNYAFFFEQNIYDKDFIKTRLFKEMSAEQKKDILLSNELVHVHLEKNWFKKDNQNLDIKLKNISSWINEKIKNNSNVHEFLSDVWSLIANKKYIDLQIQNLIYWGYNINFNNWIINFWKNDIWYDNIEYLNYDYSLRFLKKILNIIIEKNDNIDQKWLEKHLKNKTIRTYITKNFTEKDYDFIKQEYLKQWEIIVKAIFPENK